MGIVPFFVPLLFFLLVCLTVFVGVRPLDSVLLWFWGAARSRGSLFHATCRSLRTASSCMFRECIHDVTDLIRSVPRYLGSCRIHIGCDANCKLAFCKCLSSHVGLLATERST